MSRSIPFNGRKLVAWSVATAAPLLATVGCSAPAEKPAAKPVTVTGAQQQPITSAGSRQSAGSGESVDALVLHHDGTTTPIYSNNPDVAGAQQAVSNYAPLVEKIVRQREQDRIANQHRRERDAAEPPPQSRAEPVSRDAAQADDAEPPPPQRKASPGNSRPAPPQADAPAQANAAIADLHDAHMAYAAPVVASANMAGDGTNVRLVSGNRGGTVGPVVSPGVIPGGVVDPVQVLTQTFSERVGANPRDAGSQLDLQLARFLNQSLHDGPSGGTPTTAELSALPDEDREMISAVVDGLANFRAVYRNERNPLATQKAAPLLEMAERIRSRTDLSVGSIALCTAVRAYGNYEPIEPLKFRSGVANTVVFYCEVDGFQSLLDEQGRWTTKLSIELRLFTATDAGLQVWDAKADAVTDVSRKRRRDFFINKKIVLPATLNPGRYILKATVKDLQQKRVAEQHIELTLEGR